MQLFHGTTMNALKSILEDGVSGPSYWGTRVEAEPYAEDGSLLAVAVDRFDETALVPNDLLIESLRDDDSDGNADLLNLWDQSDQTWELCLRLFGSVRYDGNLSVDESDLVRDFESKPDSI